MSYYSLISLHSEMFVLGVVGNGKGSLSCPFVLSHANAILQSFWFLNITSTVSLMPLFRTAETSLMADTESPLRPIKLSSRPISISEIFSSVLQSLRNAISCGLLGGRLPVSGDTNLNNSMLIKVAANLISLRRSTFPELVKGKVCSGMYVEGCIYDGNDLKSSAFIRGRAEAKSCRALPVSINSPESVYSSI